MTFFANRKEAEEKGIFPLPDDCPHCGDTLQGPMIRYDVPGLENPALWMHRDCAFAMAQRIICDTWPNRRSGEWMQNNR